jgi:hypothetical protein
MTDMPSRWCDILNQPLPGLSLLPPEAATEINFGHLRNIVFDDATWAEDYVRQVVTDVLPANGEPDYKRSA